MSAPKKSEAKSQALVKKDADGVAIPADPGKLVVTTRDDWQMAMDTFGAEARYEMVLSLDKGQGLVGATFIGEGTPMEVGDEKMRLVNGQPTGELYRDKCKSWLLGFTAPNGARLIINLVGKHGLNQFLGNRKKGEKVALYRHVEQRDTKSGHRVNQYDTAVVGESDKTIIVT